MLKTDDFDFYYLIICSRGPGSETIVVDNVSNSREVLHFYEGSEDQFKKIGHVKPVRISTTKARSSPSLKVQNRSKPSTNGLSRT